MFERTLVNNDLFTASNDANMLIDRRGYIGGSDSYAFAADILGAPYKWNTPYTLWCSKKGYKNKSSDSNFYTTRGIESEDELRKGSINLLANLQDTGVYPIGAYQSNQTYRLVKYPFVAANLDGLIIESTGGYAGLEIKTASSSYGWENDGIPLAYQSQLQHYMLVTGLKRFYVICKIFKADENTSSIITRRIEMDSKFQGKLLKKYVDFWKNHVQKNIPPKPIGLKFEEPYLVYTASISTRVRDTLERLLYDHANAKNDIQKNKFLLKELESKMIPLLGDGCQAIVNNFKLVYIPENIKKRRSTNFDRLKQEFRCAYEACVVEEMTCYNPSLKITSKGGQTYDRE